MVGMDSQGDGVTIHNHLSAINTSNVTFPQKLMLDLKLEMRSTCTQHTSHFFGKNTRVRGKSHGFMDGINTLTFWVWISHSILGTYNLSRWVMIRVLGDAYTMDPEVVPRPYKIFDWLYIELVSGSLRFTPREKNVIVTMVVPQKTHSKVYITLWHGPICFAVDRQQNCSS